MLFFLLIFMIDFSYILNQNRQWKKMALIRTKQLFLTKKRIEYILIEYILIVYFESNVY